MQIFRECLVVEHKNKPITHLCVYKECTKDSRWACKECDKNKLHNHMQSNNYLIDKEQIIHLLSKQQTSFNQLITQIQKDVFSLTRQQIQRIINIHQQNDNQLTLIHKKNDAYNYFKEKLIESTNIKDKQELIYALHFQFDTQYQCNYQTSWITPNKKFLIFYRNGMLLIFDLELKQKLYQKNIDFIRSGAFSQDSKYFIVETTDFKRNKRVCYCFRVNQKLKLVFRLPNLGYQHAISEMIFIDTFRYLVVREDRINLNNIKINKFQTLQPQNEKLKIIASEYCQKYQTLIFVQYFSKFQLNKSKNFFIIKFMEMSTKRVIIQQKFIQTNQIQVIENNQLISTEDSNDNKPYRLCLWQINYSLQKLTILRTFNTHQEIGAFHYFIEMDKVYIYYNQSIQIINIDFQVFQEIKPTTSKQGICFSYLIDYFISITSPLIEYIIVDEKSTNLFIQQIVQKYIGKFNNNNDQLQDDYINLYKQQKKYHQLLYNKDSNNKLHFVKSSLFSFYLPYVFSTNV